MSDKQNKDNKNNSKEESAITGHYSYRRFQCADTSCLGYGLHCGRPVSLVYAE
ncbi:hypothetical protein QNN00_00040 [Bacillus velezensis]|nr:hypothetical protein [Bacillus velezensis]